MLGVRCSLKKWPTAGTGRAGCPSFHSCLLSSLPGIVVARRGTSKSVPKPSPFAIYLAAIALALAIGAKFFPIVWAPLFAVTTYRKLGWRTALAASCLGTITVALILWPMWPRTHMVALSPLLMKSTADELPPFAAARTWHDSARSHAKSASVPERMGNERLSVLDRHGECTSDRSGAC